MKRIYNIAACIAAAVCLMLNASCSEESEGLETNTDQLIVPKGACFMSVSSYTDDNETSVYATPTFPSSFGSEYLNITVKNVKYYIDGVLVQTVDKSPYELNYTTRKMTDGIHTLKYEYAISKEGFKDNTVEDSQEFSVSAQTDVQNQSTPGVIFEYDEYVKAGEKFTITPRVVNDKYNTLSISSSKLYIGNSLVDSQSTSPFTLSYTYTGSSSYITFRAEAETKGASSVSTTSFASSISLWDGKETKLQFNRTDYSSNYKNGDTLHGKIKIFKGSADEGKECKVEMLLDDNVIATITSFPYDLSYAISGLSVGIHKLSISMTLKGDSEQSSHTSSEGDITIYK